MSAYCHRYDRIHLNQYTCGFRITHKCLTLNALIYTYFLSHLSHSRMHLLVVWVCVCAAPSGSIKSNKKILSNRWQLPSWIKRRSVCMLFCVRCRYQCLFAAIGFGVSLPISQFLYQYLSMQLEQAGRLLKCKILYRFKFLPHVVSPRIIHTLIKKGTKHTLNGMVVPLSRSLAPLKALLL